MGTRLEDPTGHLDVTLESLAGYFLDRKNYRLPEPKMLKAASRLIGGYFDDIKANGDYDDSFVHNVDSVVSAMGGLIEDRYEPHAEKGSDLDNEIQATHARALNVAKEAAARAKSNRIYEHDESRSRYIDVRSFTRVAEQDPATYPALAEVGKDCATLLELGADYIQANPQIDKTNTGRLDAEGRPSAEAAYSTAHHKDYIHRHVGLILQNIGPYIMKHRLDRK